MLDRSRHTQHHGDDRPPHAPVLRVHHDGAGRNSIRRQRSRCSPATCSELSGFAAGPFQPRSQPRRQYAARLVLVDATGARLAARQLPRATAIC